MRLKLFLLFTLLASLPLMAQTGLQGVVIDARSGAAVPGAFIMLDDQGITVTSGPDGDFSISNAQPGKDRITVVAYGYKDWSQAVEITPNLVDFMGSIRLDPMAFNPNTNYKEASNELTINESQLEDEEGNTQSIATLNGASDNPFYQAASYDFSIMRFRMRGYNTEYTSTSINGINFNDAVRGRFNYSMTGGLNQAFRNRSTGIGLDATAYAFGDVGGANNINTYAKDFAPGFRGSVAYTNGNYKWRGMVTYSTGRMKGGWSLAFSAVARYADEGIVPGSFYKSYGYFLSAQRDFGDKHSIALTTFGAPTRRSNNSAVVQEAYDLAGTNLYNVNWGWQDGKKRSARIVQSYDPTVILNWIWKPKKTTTLNTGFAFHKSFYASTALSWYNAPDPRPDYYRYLPSYFSGDVADTYTRLWQTDESTRQINWDRMYYVNYLNNYEADQTGVDKPATYIIENRHSNQAVFALNSTLNMRLSDYTTLQGGLNATFTRSSYYKTLEDLLGGRYRVDNDQYAERDFPDNPDVAQNDLNNPNRLIYEGDRFGYDYNIDSWNATAWKQFVFNTAKIDASYSLKAQYTRFQRDGKMRNGRAPENSYGRGDVHEFVNAAIKGGITYKIDGRNNVTLHAYYGTRAPLPNNAYISPRIKDDVISGLESEVLWSGDIAYTWNSRHLKAFVSAYWTDQRHATERTSYYDDQYSTFVNYAMTNVHKVYRGVEVGLAYKITPSVTVSAAANIADHRYKNRPTGTRSYENGSQEDVVTTVYLKNFYVSGTPQEAYNLAFNWAAPKNWYFEVNGTWLNRAYIDMSPIRHESIETLYRYAGSNEELIEMVKNVSTQEKLNEAFVVGASIGHVVYIKRKIQLNFNLNLDNILDNRNIMTGGYQQGRMPYKTVNGERQIDYESFVKGKFPNKIYYAQGFKIFLNMGIRF